MAHKLRYCEKCGTCLGYWLEILWARTEHVCEQCRATKELDKLFSKEARVTELAGHKAHCKRSNCKLCREYDMTVEEEVNRLERMARQERKEVSLADLMQMIETHSQHKGD